MTVDSGASSTDFTTDSPTSSVTLCTVSGFIDSVVDSVGTAAMFSELSAIVLQSCCPSDFAKEYDMQLLSN